MAYTQDQINAALAAELQARPGASLADLTTAAQQYGLTPEQVSTAYSAYRPQYTQDQINSAIASELQARPGTSKADLTSYATQQYGVTPEQVSTAYTAYGANRPQYTQEQINAALATELQARPGTSQADLTTYATQQYGITPEQVSTAYTAYGSTGGTTTGGTTGGTTTGGTTGGGIGGVGSVTGATPLPLTPVQTNTATPTSATEQTLSNWAAPYITDYLADAKALADQPYQAYTGDLTAGESALQTQAFQGLAGLTVPTGVGEAAATAGEVAKKYGNLSYDPTKFTTGTFGAAEAQKYMNPYLMASLTPQLEEARRQAEISRMGDAARLSKAGAYGGSRQAIMESELNRNLMTKQNEMIGTGFNTAYDKAMAQFNAEQQRGLDTQRYGEESRQFGAEYGLKGLEGQLGAAKAQSLLGLAGLGAEREIYGDQLSAGATQRGITSEGIAADKAQFEEERAWPYQALQFQQSLMQGLPIGTTRTYGAGTDALTNALLGASAFGTIGNMASE